MRGSDRKETTLRDWLRVFEATTPIAANPQHLLACVIDELARKRGDAPALISVGESLTLLRARRSQAPV